MTPEQILLTPEQILLGIVREDSGIDDVTLDSSFETLGVDSLDFILIVKDTREKIGPVSDEAVENITTVRDLLNIATSRTTTA